MEENNIIIRSYPSNKETSIYAKRFNEHIFKIYKNISRENFEKWKSGINYNTNRKIKIGGRTHYQLGYKDFYIPFNNGYILFTELDHIDIELYQKETDRLKKEIDAYNSIVREVITKINLLERWEQYIIFEGKKYGIPHVHNRIHKQNNCFGKIEKDYWESCKCHLCEDWNGCNSREGTMHYKCLSCNYKYSETF